MSTKLMSDHWASWLINPLSSNSDQQQFSPNNIHALSRDKVMRINKMIIIEKIPWCLIKFSQLITLKEMYGDQFGEFVCGYWGLKGNVCPHPCYNQCVLYLNFIIKPTVDKRSGSLLWPECHGPLEVTKTAFQCSVSLWATILISRAQLFKCRSALTHG